MIKFETIWRHSCHNEWIQRGNYFEFFLKKGTPGKCIGDADSTRYYKFKERSEVRSTELDQGVYEWSANLEIISDTLFHAKYFSLFQVHGVILTTKPYSSLSVKHSGFNLSSPNSSKDVPSDLLKYNGKHHINVRVVIGKKKVIVRYKIDDKHIGTTSADKLQSDTLDKNFHHASVKPFLKFGAYRWEANCDVTQIYKDVTLIKKQ